MTKKEMNNLAALQDVCVQAVSYVGQANYRERESLARRNVRKAFTDFENGKKPEWKEESEEQP